MRNAIKYLLAGALLFYCVLPLSGCRPSPALTQLVFNQNEKEDISDADELMSNRADNTLEDDTISSLAQSEDTERTSGWDNVIAQYGHDDKKTDERAADVEYSAAGSSLYTSPQGPDRSRSENAAGGDEPGDVRAEDGASRTVPDTEDADAVVNEDTAGRTDENDGNETSGDDGAESELPAADTAAATGPAAALVQMLGGPDVLVAASGDYSENELLQTVFADEGAAEVVPLWPGDGSTPMTDEAFERLMELAPDVCFVFEGQEPFTDAQRERLGSDSAIRIVTLPALTGGEAIRTAVSVTAEVLGSHSGNGGQDAGVLAERYMLWYDELMARAACQDEAALYTLYIRGYDDSVVYRLVTSSEVLFEQTGLPTVLKANETAIGDLLAASGVREMATLRGSTLGRTWYVHPFSGLGVNKSVTNAASGVGFNNTNGSQIPYLTEDLGTESYPAVIAANEDTRAKLRESPLWQPGLTLYYRETRPLMSDIRGSFEIYIAPSGVGSWADGSAESPLLALWAAWRFRDTVSETEVRDAVRNFYRDFYRYDLSEEQIDAILRG